MTGADARRCQDAGPGTTTCSCVARAWSVADGVHGGAGEPRRAAITVGAVVLVPWTRAPAAVQA